MIVLDPLPVTLFAHRFVLPTVPNFHSPEPIELVFQGWRQRVRIPLIDPWGLSLKGRPVRWELNVVLEATLRDHVLGHDGAGVGSATFAERQRAFEDDLYLLSNMLDRRGWMSGAETLPFVYVNERGALALDLRPREDLPRVQVP